MSKELVIPTSYHELEEFAKTVIALYQGNPVKNQNKLNEVMAKGLNLNNWDTLSAILNQPEQYTIQDIKEIFDLDYDDLISNVFFEDDSYVCTDCGSEWDVPNICPHCVEDVYIEEVQKTYCTAYPNESTVIVPLKENFIAKNNFHICSDCGTKWDKNFFPVPETCSVCADYILYDSKNTSSILENYRVKISENNNNFIPFDTKEEALDFQRQYRKLVGLDEITGKPPTK